MIHFSSPAKQNLRPVFTAIMWAGKVIVHVILISSAIAGLLIPLMSPIPEKYYISGADKAAERKQLIRHLSQDLKYTYNDGDANFPHDQTRLVIAIETFILEKKNPPESIAALDAVTNVLGDLFNRNNYAVERRGDKWKVFYIDEWDCAVIAVGN